VFPRDIVCLRNISVDTLHKGDTEDIIIIIIIIKKKKKKKKKTKKKKKEKKGEKEEECKNMDIFKILKFL
jgi:hypothetical protein